jgi:hypothetical protein
MSKVNLATEFWNIAGNPDLGKLRDSDSTTFIPFHLSKIQIDIPYSDKQLPARKKNKFLT